MPRDCTTSGSRAQAPAAHQKKLATFSVTKYVSRMPELSRFYGIIIRMFVEISERHHVAHFHAYYQEHVGVFSISPVALIAGAVPQRQQRLVEAWAELHQEELMADWELLQQGRKPSPIQPLL